MYVKQRNGTRMSCDVGEVTRRLENEHEQSSFSNPSVASHTLQLILQPFFRFSYVTGFSLTSPGEPPKIHLCSGREVKIGMSGEDSEAQTF